MGNKPSKLSKYSVVPWGRFAHQAKAQLHAPTALIKARMKARHHPYMNPDLLDSQLAALEVPSNAWPITVAGSPEQSVEEILARLLAVDLLTSGTEKQ